MYLKKKVAGEVCNRVFEKKVAGEVYNHVSEKRLIGKVRCIRKESGW